MVPPSSDQYIIYSARLQMPRVVYIEDIIAFSDTREKHQAIFHSVLSVLRANGLVVLSHKWVFSESCVDFIGHRVTPEDILPFPDKVSAI